jgi:hypothetical protein
MNCHICTQPAKGQCQACGKFYCADRGDTVCQLCQEGRNSTSTAGCADSTGEVVIGQHNLPRSSRTRYPDIKSQPLQRVIAVAQTVEHGETEVTLVDLECLEFYEDGFFAEDGFVANFRLKGSGPGAPVQAALPVRGIIRIPIFYAKATDNQGNVYESWPASRGGIRDRWRQVHHFAPALATSARVLQLSIEEIQWMARAPGVRLPGVRPVIESGPWEFDVSLE